MGEYGRIKGKKSLQLVEVTMKFYKDFLMDHYKNPRNRGEIEHPDFETAQYNPSCGDSISIQGSIKNGVLTSLAFVGKGCVISQAVASVLTEFCIGKTIDEVLLLERGDLSKIIGMDLGPIRIKCALLSLVALKDGILEYKKRLDKKGARPI